MTWKYVHHMAAHVRAFLDPDAETPPPLTRQQALEAIQDYADVFPPPDEEIMRLDSTVEAQELVDLARRSSSRNVRLWAESIASDPLMDCLSRVAKLVASSGFPCSDPLLLRELSRLSSVPNTLADHRGAIIQLILCIRSEQGLMVAEDVAAVFLDFNILEAASLEELYSDSRPLMNVMRSEDPFISVAQSRGPVPRKENSGS